MKYSITPEVKDLGIDIRMAIFKNARISNTSAELKRLHEETAEKLRNIDPSQSPIIQEYHRLQELGGVKGALCPPEFLIKLVKKSGRFLNINTVVDCYNIVSAETLLAIGAHDLAQIKGNIVFRVTNGSEKFIPLGKPDPEKINPNEYAAMDEEEILCRMDIKQCNKSKITKDTKDFIVYIQGNRNVDPETLDRAIQKVCDLMKEICEAEYEIINP